MVDGGWLLRSSCLFITCTALCFGYVRGNCYSFSDAGLWSPTVCRYRSCVGCFHWLNRYISVFYLNITLYILLLWCPCYLLWFRMCGLYWEHDKSILNGRYYFVWPERVLCIWQWKRVLSGHCISVSNVHFSVGRCRFLVVVYLWCLFQYSCILYHRECAECCNFSYFFCIVCERHAFNFVGLWVLFGGCYVFLGGGDLNLITDTLCSVGWQESR
jgi:hypothetical protein